MNPTDILITEHRLIERALRQMQNKSKEAKENRSSLASLNQLVDFLGSYVDLCHHGKEEKILFLECESKNLSEELKNLIEELKFEHIGFRKMLEKMCVFNQEFMCGNFSNLEKSNELIEDFLLFTEKHSRKEEGRLFAAVPSLFDLEAREETLEKFREFDQAVVHEKYTQLVTNIEKGIKTGGCLD